MKSFNEFPKIFLYRPPVDMRNQMAGLTSLVSSSMAMDPFAEALYVFTNRRRDLIKCVYWDKTGFAMWVKRLDQEKFKWPKHMLEDVVHLTTRQMSFLLDGYDVWKMKKHRTLEYRQFV